ncbi:RHS repeat domain-containing protein [Chryseobacterium sp. KCF3-3]|uniref:RHS repeat domain-containing protein n=1 Tax=Chryseobacterium sp. KCF3-3 TaxID=3231511 RepID=UPI0038B38737
MRQRVTYGGNFNADGNGKFTKFYSEDGSFEVTKDNITGKEKHILYIGGSPYESSIIYVKNYNETSASYKFLHKDYLGSILAISDEAGNKLEQRHFDAWGNLTHLQIGNGQIITDVNKIQEIVNAGGLLLERGYTSHEHFMEVGIIHMNGRLYDPLLRRFLNADENIQDAYNTQSYNKYGYVMNNPLMFNDPNGEYALPAAMLVAFAAAIVTSITGDYIMNRPVNIGSLYQSVTLAAMTSYLTFGVGELFRAGGQIANSLSQTSLIIARAGAHAITQGTLSYMQGGNFWSGALSGAFASASNDLLDLAAKHVGENNILRSDRFALFNGAVSGGVGSVLGGGNFWMGAGQGLMVTAFNFLAHKFNVNSKYKKELDDAGFKPSDPAKFSNAEPMVEKVKTLNRLADGDKIVYTDNAPASDWAQYEPGNVKLNMERNKTNWDMFLSLFHELNHHYFIKYYYTPFRDHYFTGKKRGWEVREFYNEYYANYLQNQIDSSRGINYKYFKLRIEQLGYDLNELIHFHQNYKIQSK